MAHEIDSSNGIASVFTVGQTPWHGLGKTLKDAQTGDQALDITGMNWTVDKRQAYTTNKQGVIVPIPDRFALHRSDTDLALGVVGPDYSPLQNRGLVSVMDALVASKAAHYVSGGAMQEGRRVWMLLKLDAGEIRVKGDDVAHPYLFGGNGHDGWHGIEFGLTSTFIVCMNTYRRAITKAAAEGLYSKLRHTKNVGLKIEEVRQMLGVIVEPFKELEVQANRLADCKINSTQLDVFLESLGFDPDAEKGAAKEKYNLLVNSFENAPGQHLVARKGTLWGAFNAVTYYVDHGKTYKTETAKENAIIGGDGEALKAKAMRSAMAMAENL